MPKVAVEGEVTASVGTTPLSPASTGAWTAGPVSVESYAKLRVGGSSALRSASCTFSFAGSAGNTPVSDTETVQLTAQPRKVQKGLSSVLVDGDSKVSPHGNRLSASAAGKLHSA